jgi:HSP20 family protein
VTSLANPFERRKRGTDKDDKDRPDNPFGFPFAGFGPEFEKEFEREFERMQHMMNDMLRQLAENPPPGLGLPPANQKGKPPKPGQPFVYGFSLRVGPDGKPQFNEFGNTQNAAPKVSTETSDATPGVEGLPREPLADVIEHDKTVSITMEIPGVQKEDVHLDVAPDKVTLRVDAGRKYFKEIALPCRVVPKSADATFNNGVLDLTIEREAPRFEGGTRVKVK